MNPFQLDKVAHFLVGAVIGLICGYVFLLWVGVVVATFVGAVKELYDYQHPDAHTADGYDLLATVAGAVVVTPLVWMLK